MALIDFLVKVLCESPDDKPKRGSFPRRYIQKDVFKSEHALICPFRTIPDEPGLYIEGSHGIRTENLILCVKDEKNQYGQYLKDVIDGKYIDKLPGHADK